jgi:hypothetical protein
MAAVEVIYLAAATLWIGVVVAALCIGVRFAMKFRARRRRMNRILDVVRVPARMCTGLSLLADALDAPRGQIARGRRPAPRRQRRR